MRDMIPFEQMDAHLEALEKNRAWLAEITQRSPDSIRAALAPNAAKKSRSNLLQKALSEALERESEFQSFIEHPPLPGFQSVFVDDEQLDRADRASRSINSPSLAEFCRQAIIFRANEILAGNTDPVKVEPHLSMVADEPGNDSFHSTPANSVPTKYPSGRQPQKKNA